MAQVTFRLFPGFLPGDNVARVNGVSSNGLVVVGASFDFVPGQPGGAEQAVSWTAANGAMSLGTYPGPYPNPSSEALAVNADGSVIVGSDDNANAFRWTASTGKVSLGVLPGTSGSSAYAVSADGKAVAGQDFNAATNLWQSFLWTSSGGMIGLGYLPGDTQSQARGISGDGSVVVGRSYNVNNQITSDQAYRWTASTGMTGLGYLPGMSFSEAAAISSDGSVVVGDSFSLTNGLNPDQAFRWTATTGMVGLGYFPGGLTSGAAATNADGSVIVGSGLEGSGPRINQNLAFRWNAATGMQIVQDILTADGISVPDLLNYATGVSADGTVLVGDANAGGNNEGWIATIPLNAFALLDLGGVNHAIGSLVWGGTVTNSGSAAATLTTGSDNSSTTFIGKIQDGAGTTALTKIGSGTLTLTGASTYSGGTTIGGGALELAAGAAAGVGRISFAGPGETFQVDGTSMPTNNIRSFVPGDTIDLAGVTFATGSTAVVSGNSILHVVVNGTGYDLHLDPSQNWSGLHFHVTADHNNGSNISVAVDAPPILSGVAANSGVTEDGPAVALAPSLAVSDPDDTTLAGATVSVTSGGFAGDGDLLSASTAGTAITASYDSVTEKLTLSGIDTLAHYQSVLDAVTFSAGENPTNFGANPTRTVTWSVTDAVGVSSAPGSTTTINITAVNDPPVLANVAPAAAFTEEGGAVTLANAVSVTDLDDRNLSGATVAITGGTFANDADVLAASTAGTSITATYNASAETLTLSGLDTLAHYQSVLDTVTFNAGENPTNFGLNPTRTVTWTLTDPGGTANGGVNVSTPVTSTINVANVNDPPVLANVAPAAAFTEEGGAVTLANAVSVTDPDDRNLSGATVAITGGTFANDNDVLAANTAGTGITASYNASTETLTLSGLDTLGHYQSVLDTVTFNAGENPTNFGLNPTRTVTWTLVDPSGTANGGVNTSTPVTSTVNVTNANDPPAFSNVAAAAAVTSPGQTVTLSPALSVSDLDDRTLAGATVRITGGKFAGDGDVLAATTTATNISANYDPSSETLTLSGTDTLADYAKVLDSVTFNSTSGDPTQGGAATTRTVTWTANDGHAANNLSTPAVTTISLQQDVPFDFNGDAISDLVFQNNGEPAIWLWNGASPTAEVTFSNPGSSWHIVTSRDVNGDGMADLVWQNSDGTPGIWLMNGTTPLAAVALTNPGASWHLLASGDTNGDGKSDLIWQNTDGTLAVWLMNGTTPTACAGLTNPGADWKVIGAADYNADGRDDILLQNAATGNLMIDLMNGTSIASSVSIAVGDPSWHAVSTGEFNGQAEIAWQNSNGTPALWLMNGTSPAAAVDLPNPGAAWKLISIDHFTPGGQADLLFQNPGGALGLWEMNGTSIAAAIGLPNPGAGWQSVNGHPFAA
jgi:autotransporter-associated beta strand protein